MSKLAVRHELRVPARRNIESVFDAYRVTPTG